ncbi:MAG: hypothetical protein GTN35_03745 [Nitrososphaeria archaeon]|nr:hypothetical protein [Nitrosopumilaceae archaeon]NIP10132.1 hypothetical protein [Nitrosopumilaceae archaeon]NIP91496.1 hypothetical protein [Nitrososphaeria archaeon]NIS95331.1 hypothetical protein [Nitrosopumilaceae archaeon]
MNKTLLQYYCGHCNNILKEINTEIGLVRSIEPCPFCGTLLSDSLQQRKMSIKPCLPSIVFQRASQLPKLTFDIDKLDSVLHFLTPHHKICIAGIHTQKLVERLCVRAQLPRRYGGLDSKVLLIDGANSSDLYQCVDFAQQYGLDVKKILSGIISCRTFTVYQLANLIVNELSDAIKQYGVKIVIITHLLHFFTNDPFLNTNEMQQVLKSVVQSLKKIQNCLVVVSLDIPTKFDGMLLQLFSKTIKIRQSYNTLSVNIDDLGKTQSVLIDTASLELIPQH